MPGQILDKEQLPALGGYQLIQTFNQAGGALVLTNIPSGFSDLLLVFRTTGANYLRMLFRVSGDNGATWTGYNYIGANQPPGYWFGHLRIIGYRRNIQVIEQQMSLGDLTADKSISDGASTSPAFAVAHVEGGINAITVASESGLGTGTIQLYGI